MFMMLKIEKVSEKQVCNLLAIDVCWNFQLCKAVNHSLISISVFGPCYMLADPVMQNLECGWGTIGSSNCGLSYIMDCHRDGCLPVLKACQFPPHSEHWKAGREVHNGWGMPALHGERAVAVSLIFSFNLNKLHIPDIEWSLSIHCRIFHDGNLYSSEKVNCVKWSGNSMNDVNTEHWKILLAIAQHNLFQPICCCRLTMECL